MTENNTHPLMEVWKNNPEVFTSKPSKLDSPTIEDLFADFFSLGHYYYYILDVPNSTVSHLNENILAMHGLRRYPTNLSDIIALIHPDDIPFVIAAEEMCYQKIREIAPEHLLHLKSSYCFRMKTRRINYELFHHQAIHTMVCKEGKVQQAINIHTNIQHLTHSNPYTALVIGIGGRDDYHELYYRSDNGVPPHKTVLTHREIEVLSLIAKGMSAVEISKHLKISEHTVRTHRKHLLAKSSCKNSSELIRKAYEDGFI